MFKKKRIFISYKRVIEPDEPIALEVFSELSKKYNVFIDQTMLVGTKWAKEIENQLKKSDFLISFISESSVNSEMVLAEIQTAHRLNKLQGKPLILPVRLKYKKPLVYPLSAYLDPINYIMWEGRKDTKELIDQLNLAISGEKLSAKKVLRKSKETSKIGVLEPLPSASPLSLESPEGSMNPHSKFYITRNSDKIALKAIKQNGVTITIKGPRQTGKSSLLNNILKTSISLDKRVVFLDFQLIEKSTLSRPETFYKHFCKWLTYELGLEDKVDSYWNAPLGNAQLCTRYIRDYVISTIKKPLVLAMDEVDRMFDTKYRSDFFGMLRSWHNNRAFQLIWNNLDIALVTSTEPYLFIDDLNQSPFNVGEVIELEDFTIEDVSELNKRHKFLLTKKEVVALLNYFGGHPYLTRKAFYFLFSRKISFEEFLNIASEDYGPFGDHLRSYLFRLQSKKELLSGFSEILENRIHTNNDIYFRLRGAGLVRSEGKKLIPRNQLYAIYFTKHLK